MFFEWIPFSLSTPSPNPKNLFLSGFYVCYFSGVVIVILMFSVPLMSVPFNVEVMPSSTFLVSFWMYGFSGRVFPLMSMLA